MTSALRNIRLYCRGGSPLHLGFNCSDEYLLAVFDLNDAHGAFSVVGRVDRLVAAIVDPLERDGLGSADAGPGGQRDVRRLQEVAGEVRASGDLRLESDEVGFRGNQERFSNRARA